MDKIPIDEATKQIVLNLIRTRTEIDERLRLILQVYLNIKELKGDWTFSKDFSELVKI